MRIGFVNGSYHGAWYFDKMIKLLKQDGIEAFAALPNTFEQLDKHIDMCDCINMIFNELKDSDEKIILVGHSSGGQIISNFAEVHSENVAKLIYVSGTLLPTGCSNFDIPRGAGELPQYPISQVEGDYKWYLSQTEDEKKRIYNYFYNCCSYDEAENAISRLQPQSLRVLQYKNNFTKERFGSIDKYYIKCLKDHVIFPSVQDKMVDMVNCKKIYEIDSDHVPFLSNPQELLLIIKDILRV